MKKINKLTLHKLDVEPSEILRKKDLKHIMGSYGSIGRLYCIVYCKPYLDQNIEGYCGGGYSTSDWCCDGLMSIYRPLGCWYCYCGY